MRLSRVVRSGALVGVGPAGLPPAELRTFESTPSLALAPLAAERPEGSRLHRQDGVAAWDRLAGQWRDLSALGALFAASNDLGWLIALCGAAGFPANILDVLAKYELGWRPREVVYDEDFTAQTAIAVGGLSSARRYSYVISIDYAGSVTVYPIIIPTGGAGTVDSGIMGYPGGWAYNPTWVLCALYPGQTEQRICEGRIHPRVDGYSAAVGTCRQWGNLQASEIMKFQGTTNIDFTGLTFSATSPITGHLTIWEESP